MEQQKRRQIKELVYQACTKSTGNQIDPTTLSNIKNICKKSDDSLECAFEQIWHSLKNKSSQPRYYALLLVNELFTRSAKFRQQLCQQFQEFIALTVTGDEEMVTSKKKKQERKKSATTSSSSDIFSSNMSQKMIIYELPPPQKYATLLRETALRCIEEWEEKYGATYPPLKLGYSFLKKVCKIRMPNIREQREYNQRRQEERDENTKKIALLKYDRVKQEYNDNLVPLSITLQQMEICFKMIVPDFEDLFGDVFTSSGKEATQQQESNQPVITENTSTTSNTAASSSNADEDDWEDVDLETNNVTNEEEVFAAIAEDEEYNDNSQLIDDGYDDLNHFILSAGLGSSSYEITVEHSLDNLKNVDNTLAFDLLQEALAEVKTKYQPMVKEWLSVLTALVLPPDTPLHEKQKYDQIMRVIIELKEKINEGVTKCTELNIKSQGKKKTRYSVPELSVNSMNLKRKAEKSTDSNKRRKLL
jgi:hypothetical protein